MKSKYGKPIGIKFSRLFPFVLVIVSLVSCKSKEEKVENLIKEEMFRTLYDYASYEPIETSIDSAFTSIYRDSTIMYYGFLLSSSVENAQNYLDRVKEAQSSMEIWRFSYSSYGVSEYESAREEFNENYDKFTEEMEIIDSLQKIIVERTENFESIFCGWQAKHKFRCKTRGGNYDLANYLFVFDPDIQKIIYREDTEDQGLLKCIDLIDESINDKSEVK